MEFSEGENTRWNITMSFVLNDVCLYQLIVYRSKIATLKLMLHAVRDNSKSKSGKA